MMECSASQMEFKDFGKCRVIGIFGDGRISSGGGILLLCEID